MELVDREKLLKDMGERPKVNGSGLYALGAVNQYDMDRLAVETAPTVDAVPVKHGRWIHHKGGYSDHYECTVCGKSIVLTAKWDFCPMCGARMDLKDGERDG